MKKKLGIALVLALVAVMISGGTVLAWDYEDPCVADNEDFIAGGGFDDGVGEFNSGAQPWPYFKAPNGGYNLYIDDVTDTGNLDSAFILTRTPGEVDLPLIQAYDFPATGKYWYVGDFSSNTWYWATEPRGYDAPAPPNCIKINLPDASVIVQYCGQAVSAVDFNDGTWRIEIPAGTWILDSNGSMAFSLVVDSDGNITSDIRFVYCRGGRGNCE